MCELSCQHLLNPTLLCLEEHFEESYLVGHRYCTMTKEAIYHLSLQSNKTKILLAYACPKGTNGQALFCTLKK